MNTNYERYHFMNLWCDGTKSFDNEEAAIEFFNTMAADFRYCDVEIVKGKTIYVDFSKMVKWVDDSWKVGWKKVSLIKRLQMAINA